MKQYLYFFIIAILLCSCEGKSTKNQPSIPSIWTPQYKVYVSDITQNNPYGYPFYAEVIIFNDGYYVEKYCTTNEDFSNDDRDFDMGYYHCYYPDVTLTIREDKYLMQFKDTLTLYSDLWNRTYLLKHSY